MPTDRTRNQERLVADYLAETAPKTLLAALQALADSQFPIDDTKALREQLDKSKTEATVLDLLQPVDFPLASPRNAFDKLVARWREWITPLPLPPELPEDRPERPSACDIFEDTFGSLCGAQACAAYAEAARSLNQYQALLVGHSEGRRCQERLARELFERSRSPWGFRP